MRALFDACCAHETARDHRACNPTLTLNVARRCAPACRAVAAIIASGDKKLTLDRALRRSGGAVLCELRTRQCSRAVSLSLVPQGRVCAEIKAGGTGGVGVAARGTTWPRSCSSAMSSSLPSLHCSAHRAPIDRPIAAATARMHGCDGTRDVPRLVRVCVCVLVRPRVGGSGSELCAHAVVHFVRCDF